VKFSSYCRIPVLGFDEVLESFLEPGKRAARHVIAGISQEIEIGIRTRGATRPRAKRDTSRDATLQAAFSTFSSHQASWRQICTTWVGDPSAQFRISY